MNDINPSGTTQYGGRGRLADVIATRGGLASPEAPFVIEHREALIYMLCEAAELEHGIMCQYLFATFSLKQSADEGLTEPEVAAVQGWRRHVSRVAVQEMLHLALVHNLLTSIGAAPHMARPNLPAPAAHYPAGVQLALLPFGEKALQHFMFLERPETWDLEDAEGMEAIQRAAPVISARDIVPQGQDFATVGHLYRSIEAGFEHLVELHGEEWLFVGPARAQATRADFGWPELVEVTDLGSAKQAIEEILEQGEGARTGDWKDSHFGQFVAILDDYQQMSRDNPDFDAVRPVMAANVRPAERDVSMPLITDRATSRVADLFNVGYEILLQMFERYFAHTEETDGQLKVLADATIALMQRVIKPIGDLLTRLPVGEAHPDRTAGPSFELFYESDYLMPHRDAAWALLAERLNMASWLCEQIQLGPGASFAADLTPVLNAMREISSTLAAHLPTDSSHASLAAPVKLLDADELGALLREADDLAGVSASRHGTANPLAGLADVVHAIIAEAAATRGCDLTQQAQIVPRLVHSVLRPLADALRSQPANPADDSADEAALEPAATDLVARVWSAAQAATKLRVALAADCHAGLIEAAAGLQDLACAMVPAAEAERRRDALWELQSGLQAGIAVVRGGPYLVTNVPRLVDYLGTRCRPAPDVALCRCGRSAIKPLCDGSHASGFADGKDPNRVPDQRDTYPGVQVTVFDNRGICQHSGLCTDRLANAFRSSTEPFVAPSGARLDEIIRAVRDCPSGALSYALDGTEARDQVDWGGTREPSVEVTKDGPYRVTGRIALTEAGGAEPNRAVGSSREHYALCRCGQSQNKPFCSGMHWYVQFRDPVLPTGHEPTPFEWAGGLPALTRAARLLYEKHIPADPLLAPVFAATPPDQPYRLAAWLAPALGQPGSADGDVCEAIGITSALTEEQRNRWTTLAAASADESKLPDDPGFRAALSACLEWVSRQAVAVASGAAAPTRAPRWDWGPGGPPAPVADQAAQAPSQVDLPGPDEEVGYAAHIKPLFRDRDRQSMSFAFDLWSFDDVRAHADGILQRLRDGSMPCDGAWSKDMVDVFSRWTETGTRP